VPGATLEDAKVALSHDWLLSIGGGERCLAIFAELFPDASIYTSIFRPEVMGGLIPEDRVWPSFLNNWPEYFRRRHRMLLPLMPVAFSQFDIGDVDLILSSSHCAAKGIRKPEGAVHACFCYSPMRYVWDLYETYLAGMKGITRYMFRQFAPPLRKWDKLTAGEVDVFIAISDFIAERIKRVYERDSVVIYPPVDCLRFTIDEKARRDEHFLVLSRLVNYKRVDIAVDAFRELPYKLRVVGTGPQMAELKSKAGANVEFAGFVDEDKLVDEYRRARAVIVTAIEDFGLVPVEAASCGTPTIALGAGGYLETVRDEVSGVFFAEQSPASVADAVRRFAKMNFAPLKVRESALRFDVPRFKQQIMDIASRAIGGFKT